MTKPNPGSASSKFGERQVSFFELLQVQSLEKGLSPTLVWQVRSSEKGQFLYLDSEPWQVRSSDRAKPWFGMFGVRPVPFSDSEPKLLTRVRPFSFSELRTSRACRTRVHQTLNMPKPGFGPVPSPNSEPKLQTRVRPGYFSELRTCQTSVRPIPFSELQTQTPNQGLAWSFLRTPNRDSG